nr:MAG TPA: hypothetical protein [Caudoviricetes sp.]
MFSTFINKYKISIFIFFLPLWRQTMDSNHIPF